jgi:hypothetical protein
MFYCKKVINEDTGETCNTELKPDGADSRQEWCNTFYFCPKCNSEYTLYTVYKMQSHVIESEVLYDENGKAVE